MRTHGSPQWLEAVRRLAVGRVLDGYAHTEVAEFLGVSLSSVKRWVAQYHAGGEAALAAVPHPGPPPKLTPRQAERVLAWVRDRRPQDLGFAADAGTHWTARRVAAVIRERFGVRFNPRYLNDWLARGTGSARSCRSACRASGTRRGRRPVAGGRLAGDQKGAAAAGATLVFTDETGLLMAPLLRTTLAERGHTPLIEQRASHRDKVSVAAALWKTPCGGLVRLAFRTYPDRFVNNERYAEFLEEVLTDRLRRVPAVIVIHDRGTMHRGEPVEGLLEDYDRLLGFEPLPAYAPELDPVEELWDWLKYDELANFAPRDVGHLDRVINDRLYALHRDQPRLRTFLASSPLKW